MKYILAFFISLISCIFYFSPIPASYGAANCSGADSLCSPDFTVRLDNFSFANSLIGGSAKETINNTIGTIIQKLMIAFGVIALLIMTIGAGYMVIYHGDDELLSRGKGIFTGGITALIIALSSYYIVDLVRYILYSN